MKKKKHDRELYRLVKRLENMPFNKNGTDKSYVLNALFLNNDYFSKVKKSLLLTELKLMSVT
jgi:hypothetical protein